MGFVVAQDLTVRINRGNRRGVSLRRSWHHAGNPRRPCRLYRVLAASPEERQAGDLHRRQPRAEGRRLSPQLAAAGRDRRRDAASRIRIDRGGRAERRGLCRAGRAAGQGRVFARREAERRVKARRNILRFGRTARLRRSVAPRAVGPDDSGLRGREGIAPRLRFQIGRLSESHRHRRQI